MSLKTKALIAILITAALWGSAGTVAKLLLQSADPFVITFWRFSAAALIILPFLLRVQKPKGWLRNLLPLGIFNAANVLFYYTGLTMTTANTGSLIGTSVPLITAVLSWFLIGETVSRPKLIGVILGLAGSVLIVFIPILERGVAVGTSIPGNLCMVGSAIAWALYIVRSRSEAQKKSFQPIVATFVNFLTCAVAALGFSLLTHKHLWIDAFASASYVGLFFYTVIGITVVTFFLFGWGVQHVTATTASLKEYAQLIVGVSINSVVLGERFTPLFFVGSILILSGVTVATGRQLSKKITALLFANGK